MKKNKDYYWLKGGHGCHDLHNDESLCILLYNGLYILARATTNGWIGIIDNEFYHDFEVKRWIKIEGKESLSELIRKGINEKT